MIRTSFNIPRLKDPNFQSKFQEKLEEKFQHGLPTDSSYEKWSSFKDAVIETSKEVLEPKTRTHEDWFDENDDGIKRALHAKNKAYIEWQNDLTSVSKRDRFKTLKAKAQSDIRSMKEKWWQDKAEEVQCYADAHNYKKFFMTLETVFGPSASCFSPLLSSDGTTLIKDQEGLSKRWQEHFRSLLNRPSSVDTDALNQIPQQQIKYSLAESPTIEEIRKAISQISSGKAPGKDGIPVEIYKTMGSSALEAFHEVLLSIWEQEAMPDEFHDALIVSLYKNKGSKSDCGNYRGISLLSTAGKILAKVLLNRIMTVSEQNLPEAQRGFRPGRSTDDMVFAMRQLQEKCIEQSMPLNTVFIDLTKAFDTVNREALWTVLERIRCPPKLISMIRLFHDDITGQVLSNGNVTEAFKITNGVKQGCVLAPVLFNVFFSCMLSHATRGLKKGVYIWYRLDGSLFDLRRLTAKTKSKEMLLLEILFADDCALLAHTEYDIQMMMDSFSEASKLFSLTISLNKMEVLHQPAPNTHPPAPSITVGDAVLLNVNHYTTVKSYTCFLTCLYLSS